MLVAIYFLSCVSSALSSSCAPSSLKYYQPLRSPLPALPQRFPATVRSLDRTTSLCSLVRPTLIVPTLATPLGIC